MRFHCTNNPMFRMYQNHRIAELKACILDQNCYPYKILILDWTWISQNQSVQTYYNIIYLRIAPIVPSGFIIKLGTSLTYIHTLHTHTLQSPVMTHQLIALLLFSISHSCCTLSCSSLIWPILVNLITLQVCLSKTSPSLTFTPLMPQSDLFTPWC